jgi:hypothetical protein
MKPDYSVDTAFSPNQDNLLESLTRLNEKVDRQTGQAIKLDTAEVEARQQRIIDLESPPASTDPMPSYQVTAPGGQVTFPVGFDMTSDVAANYDVSINGLVQDPLSDYTIDAFPNEITFTTSPSSGDDIVITQRDTSTFDAEQAISDFLTALQS